MHRLGVGALRRCSSAGAASGHRNGGGTVRWWKSRKGFGFITADDPTQDAILAVAKRSTRMAISLE